MQPVIYYCYDAYCGWCYGFSPVIKKIADEYKDLLSLCMLRFSAWYKNHQHQCCIFPTSGDRLHCLLNLFLHCAMHIAGRLQNQLATQDTVL